MFASMEANQEMMINCHEGSPLLTQLGVVISLLYVIFSEYLHFSDVRVSLPGHKIDLFEQLLLVILQLSHHL